MKALAMAFLLATVLVIVGLVWAVRRAVISAKGRVAPDTAKLHLVGEQKRDEIRGQTLSGANVKEMTDEQLEEYINAHRRPPAR